MIRTAVFGYGNVGRQVVETVLNTPDFTLAAVVDQAMVGMDAKGVTILGELPASIQVDVAILAVPSRLMPALAEELLTRGIHTVDGFDIHTQAVEVWRHLGRVAKKHNCAAVLSAGWDPGTDSIIRALFSAMAPAGITYTDFGPGMSMGHTVVAKGIPGVRDALSVTIPIGTGLHRRMVYIELESGHDFERVAAAIKADDYFAHDETHVMQVERVKALKDMGHGVRIERKGVSGVTDNQLFCFDMKINNPALTAQVLVCAARAACKQQPGCYTMIEIPPVDFLPQSREQAIHDLV